MPKLAIDHLREVEFINIRKSDNSVQLFGADTGDVLHLRARGDDNRFMCGTFAEAMGFARGLSQLMGRPFVIVCNNHNFVTMVSYVSLSEVLTSEEMRERYGCPLPLLSTYLLE